ncbi:MAG: tetratricopeptide repeat protein [Desulfomonilaceae bacterium]
MKSFRILILLTLVFATLGPGFSAAEIADRQQYNAGLVAMKNGNFREALQHFTRAAEINPNEYKYYNDRGVAYKRLGDLEKALADYNKSLEINPHYTNALNNRGVVYLEQGHYDQALADFQEALKYGGLEGKIFTNIGIAKAAKGDYRSAIKDFDNAVSLHPVDPRSFLFMGQSLEHLGDRDKALKMYQVALGVIKEPEIIAFVEKKIAALDSNSTGSSLPRIHKESNIQSEKSPKTNSKLPAKSTIVPAKKAREVVLANRRPDYIEQIAKQISSKPAQTDLPDDLKAYSKQMRNKIIGQLAPASAEILHQAHDFVEKSDDYKAMVRFEDIRQLERRNKNYRAVAWALLEIGKIYIRRGDYLKAEESLDSSLKISSTLKASGEKILALIELARLRKLESSTDKAKTLFTQAQDLANTSGHSTLNKAIQDLESGAFDQRKNAPIQLNSAQTKLQTDKIVPQSSVPRLTAAQSNQTETPDASEKTRNSNTHNTKLNFVHVKSVFNMKPGNFQKMKTASQPSASGSATNASSKPKNYAAIERPQQKDEAKNGVTAPTAAIHPDARKPVVVESVKRRGIERAISQKDVKPPINSINSDINELKRLRKEKDEVKMIPVLENLSRNFSELGDYKKALDSMNVSLAFREKLGINDGRAKALEFRGMVHEKLGKKVEALEDLTWAGMLSKNLREFDRAKTRNLAQSLGLEVVRVLDNYRALWSARESGDTKSEIKSLLELGNLYAGTQNFEEASKYYELSNASLMAERSVCYKKLGKLGEARKTMDEALQTLKSLDYLLYFSFMNRSEYHDKLSAVQR